MTREQARQLLAQLIFDELDEPTKTRLLAYLQTDPELSEQLGDLRLTVQALRSATEATPAPALDESRRTALLQQLAAPPPRSVLARLGPATRHLLTGRVAAVAAVLVGGLLLIGFLLPAQGAARRTAMKRSGGVTETDSITPLARLRPPKDADRRQADADWTENRRRSGTELTLEGAHRPMGQRLALGGRVDKLGYERDAGGVKDGYWSLHQPARGGDSPAAPELAPVPQLKRFDHLQALNGPRANDLEDRQRLAERAEREKPAESAAPGKPFGSAIATGQGFKASFYATAGNAKKADDEKDDTGESKLQLMKKAEEAQSQTVAPLKIVPVNPWVMTQRDRFSTFALDVDTASYAIARRHIRQGQLPPIATVRMEEFVNAFDYCYPTGKRSGRVFAVHADAAPAPFGQGLTLLKIGVRGKVVGRDQARPAHLVFVIDASGSMDRADRMGLVKKSLKMLVEQLAPQDRLTLITYDTQPNLLLELAPGSEPQAIRDAVDSIQCRGSTNLLAGVKLGYQMATRHFTSGAVNRVILMSDGVANVGPTDTDEMLRNIAHFRGQGLTFTSVGFGAGAYNDQLLEQLSNKGDGSYLYVGSEEDAQRVLVTDASATLPTIARNAKIQVEFNPARVRRYRLIGYENRDLADRDFRNDAVEAGAVGSGQSVTALYELELLHGGDHSGGPDLGTVFVRYENADTGKVEEISTRLADSIIESRTPASDPHFFLAAAAAEFAEILRESEHASGGGNLEAVRGVLQQVCNVLPLDQRARELLELVTLAPGLPRAAP